MQNWGYLSGLLRAEKNNFLTNNQILALADVVNTEGLAKSLEDTHYGSYFQGKALKDFTEIFDLYYQEKFDQIQAISPDPLITNLHALKTDLNNFKLCYKAKKSQTNIEWEKLSENGTVEPEKMFTIVDQGLWNELPKCVGIVAHSLDEENLDSPRKIDFLIDKAYYQYRIDLLQEASQENADDYAIILDFYKKELDCENIKNMFRAKTMELDKEAIIDMIIPKGYMSLEFFTDYANLSPEDLGDLILDSAYGTVLAQGIEIWLTNRSCTVLEKQIDEYLLSLIGNFSYKSQGPVVIEETLRSLMIEIKNLKLIIIGKINNMKTEEIKERLRHVSY